MQIEYRILKEITPDEQNAMAELYREVGWIGPGDSAEFIAAGMANSAIAVGAYADGRIIGMGRALSDNVSDAYIQETLSGARLRSETGPHLLEAAVTVNSLS